MSDLGRPVDILMMTMKRGVAEISRQRPLKRIDGKAGSSSMNLVGLESQLSDKVKLTRGVTLHGNQTERGRIKVNHVGATSGRINREDEIRMVQDIDGRGLELKPDSFRDPNAFDDAHIQLKILWAAKTVHRKVAERTRSRSRHQARLKFGSGNFAGRVAR